MPTFAELGLRPPDVRVLVEKALEVPVGTAATVACATAVGGALGLHLAALLRAYTSANARLLDAADRHLLGLSLGLRLSLGPGWLAPSNLRLLGAAQCT